MTLWKNLVVALVAAFALAACSSSDKGDGTDTGAAEPTPQEQCETAGGQWSDGSCTTAYQIAYQGALNAIAAAETAEEAQAAYDAVKDVVTAADGDKLQAAVDTRKATLATMAREAEQKADLAAAAGMIDTSDLSTQEAVDAARTAIVGLREALKAAADVSEADKAMYMSQLNAAVDAVDDAQGGIDTATRRTNQTTALSSASKTLQAALAALSGATPTQAQLDDANNALTALKTAIEGGADLTDDEKATYVREAANAAAPISTAQAAKDKADDDADDTANAAMAVTAAKLYTGIGDAPLTSTGVGQRSATYGNPEQAGQTANDIVVTYDHDNSADTNAVARVLSMDKKTTLADNHGWEGNKYTYTVPSTEASGAGDMYEAVVYSNVEDPTPGRKFGAETVDQTDATRTYEYDLADGVLNETTTEGTASRVASSSFDHSAGVKTFKVPEDGTNPTSIKPIEGKYHGVSGYYHCTPGNGNTCAVRVAAQGFNLGGVTSANVFNANNAAWTFKPKDKEDEVMSAEDTIYASYGWWIKKAAHNGPLTVSAFVANKGTVPAASGLDNLNGTATYRGGAAGEYALSSSTGGTNDAGHFTARATLEADFTNNTAATAITGTIDMFIGADGQSRDWEVELMGSAISDDGAIGDSTDGTAWTIGGTAADDSGEWSGTLRDNGDDGVPKVATGTFYTEYGKAGRMVGAFGANVQ